MTTSNLKSFGLYYISIFVLLFCGANVLHVLGWNIDYYAAPAYQKIRPEFYLLFICLLKNKVYKISNTEKDLLFFTIFVFIYWIISGQFSGFAVLINTICIPVIISCLALKLDAKQIKQIMFLILAFYIINSTLAISERFLNYNLFPYYTGGETLVVSHDDLLSFRSTALRNHPLGNALLISTISAFTIISNKLSLFKRISLFILGYTAIMCFNARACMIIVPILLFLYIAYNISIKNVLQISKFKLIVSFTLFIIIGLYLFGQGWGGRLLEKGNLNDSSVEARLILYEKFFSMDFTLFLFGMSNEAISSLIRMAHIESYWLLYLCRFGIFILLYYLYLFYKLLKQWMKGFPLANRIFVVLVLLLLSSTNNSIYSGDPVIAVFILCCLTLWKKNAQSLFNN